MSWAFINHTYAVNFSVTVNTSNAGQGTLTAEVKGQTSQPGVTISGIREGLSVLSFIPVETGKHMIFVYFNNINIPGWCGQNLGSVAI
jgi:hypothetical protein